MAHGPTRKALQGQLMAASDKQEGMAREIAILRRDLEYAHQATDNVRAQVRQIASDRERLTATVEILARRLASEGSAQPTGVQYPDWPPTNRSVAPTITERINEPAKVPSYSRH